MGKTIKVISGTEKMGQKIEITYKEKESANTADSIIANNIIDGKLVDHA